jgi:hypothetical protein
MSSSRLRLFGFAITLGTMTETIFWFAHFIVSQKQYSGFFAQLAATPFEASHTPIMSLITIYMSFLSIRIASALSMIIASAFVSLIWFYICFCLKSCHERKLRNA